jgi:hypothetical protein
MTRLGYGTVALVLVMLSAASLMSLPHGYAQTQSNLLQQSTSYDLIQNGGFEQGNLDGWNALTSHPGTPPTVETSVVHSGTYAVAVYGSDWLYQDVAGPYANPPTPLAAYPVTSADYLSFALYFTAGTSIGVSVDFWNPQTQLYDAMAYFVSTGSFGDPTPGYNTIQFLNQPSNTWLVFTRNIMDDLRTFGLDPSVPRYHNSILLTDMTTGESIGPVYVDDVSLQDPIITISVTTTATTTISTTAITTSTTSTWTTSTVTTTSSQSSAQDYTISVNTNPANLASPANMGDTTSGGGVFPHGYVDNISVANVAGYSFQVWQRDGQNYTRAKSFIYTVDGSHVFTALFTQPTYEVSFFTFPSSVGSITLNGQIYVNGQHVNLPAGIYQIAALQAQGFNFTHWDTSIHMLIWSPMSPTTKLTVEGDGAVFVFFKQAVPIPEFPTSTPLLLVTALILGFAANRRGLRRR